MIADKLSIIEILIAVAIFPILLVFSMFVFAASLSLVGVKSVLYSITGREIEIPSISLKFLD
jgi:hypothetical protein